MKIKILISFIMILMLGSCGYNPIFYKENNTFKINEINMIGVSKINNIIRNNLKNIQSDANDAREFQIEIITKKTKSITSKNSKGDSKSFSLRIDLELVIKENNDIIKKNNFQKSYNYNNTNNKFDLSKNEKIIEQNLSERLAEEIILFLYSI